MDKKLSNNELNDAFGIINLSEEQKSEIWKEINNSITNGKKSFVLKNKNRNSVTYLKRTIPIAASFVIIIGILYLINFATNGSLVKAFSNYWNAPRSNREVVTEIVDYHSRLQVEYAPKLVHINENRVIIASTKGLIIYDVKKECISGIINLQEYECNYLEGKTLKTQFVVQNDKLIIFNLNDNKLQGNYYVFDLKKCKATDNDKILLLKPIKKTIDLNALDINVLEYNTKNSENAYNHFYEFFENQKTNYIKYSEIALINPVNGEDYVSCLVMEQVFNDNIKRIEYDFVIYNKNKQSGEIHKTDIDLGEDKISLNKEKSLELPVYEYAGEDMIEKSIADCFVNNLDLYNGSFFNSESYIDDIDKTYGDIILPIIEIVDIKEDENQINVYGMFKWNTYYLSGNALYDAGYNGGGIGMIRIEKINSECEVVKVIHPNDGGAMFDDLMEMTEGDESLAEKIFNIDAEYNGIHKEKIKEYITQYKLPIKYYKEEHHEPVLLFE